MIETIRLKLLHPGTNSLHIVFISESKTTESPSFCLRHSSSQESHSPSNGCSNEKCSSPPVTKERKDTDPFPISKICQGKMILDVSELPGEWQVAARAAANSWNKVGANVSIEAVDQIDKTKREGFNLDGKCFEGLVGTCQIRVVLASKLPKEFRTTNNWAGMTHLVSNDCEPNYLTRALIIINDFNYAGWGKTKMVNEGKYRFRLC